MPTPSNPYFVRSADNSANRDTARAISLQVIADVLPDQVDASSFVVEPLIDRAAQGQVVRAGSDKAFALGGIDLLILVVVPIVINLLTEAFKAARVATIEELKGQLVSPPVVSEIEVQRMLKLTSIKAGRTQIAAMTRAINAIMGGWSGIRSLPSIGIITALPKEYAAIKAVLEHPQDVMVEGAGGGRRYLLGEIPALQGGTHHVVLSLAEMGNNNAAIRATLLLEHFPNVKSIVMAGIAGGVPHPQNPDEHVRLGDIVVSGHQGVIQYDFDKEDIEEAKHRHAPRPPSAVLLEAVRLLEIAEIEGRRPWVDHIEQLQGKLDIQRPAPESDIFMSLDAPSQHVGHPGSSPWNRERTPRVFQGPIASGNKLLKNPLKRDALRDKFGVKAVEMEASGIADATWNHEVGYLVVRGICDYCDSNKNDAWQQYAAIAAAGYTRTLIESIPLPS